MDQSAQPMQEVPAPSAARVVAGTLPGAVLAASGIPLLAWWMLDGAGEAKTAWWPIPILALIGVIVLVDHYARPPRPAAGQRLNKERLMWALSSAPRKGTVPKDPLLRNAVVAAACSSIEAFVFMSAVLVGVVLSALIRLEFSWGPAEVTPVRRTPLSVSRAAARRRWD